MSTGINRLAWRESLPRLIADLLTVHASMIAALVVSALYQTIDGDPAEARDLIQQFQHYYVSYFCLMTPIFPVTFWLFGFYTHSRSYVGRYKALVILEGVAVSVAVYVAVTSLLFAQDDLVGRSVALPFAVLVFVGVSATRLSKMLFESRFVVFHKASPVVKQEPSTVLVVGGAGYLGSILVRQLLDANHHVRVLDKLIYGDSSIKDVMNHPGLELMTGDCRNIGDVVEAMRNVGTVVDLAAIVGDPACEEDRQSALEVNYAATLMLMEIAKAQKVKRFIFASTCSVYGATSFEVDELGETKPLSFYALTKVQSEDALLSRSAPGFHPTILRFATVFGLGYRPRFDLVVNLLCARAQYDRTITIYNGEQWRPFIHVRDAARAILMTAQAPVSMVSGEIFNVGDSRLNHTLNQLAEMIQREFPNTRVEHVDNTDLRNYRVSFEKLRSRLDYSCEFTLRDGIVEWKKAFENNLIVDYKDIRYNNQQFLQAARLTNKNEKDAQIMAAFVSPNGPQTAPDEPQPAPRGPSRSAA